jgi:hypothetical protein
MSNPTTAKARKRPKFRMGQVVARTSYEGSGKDAMFVRLKEYCGAGPAWFTDEGVLILETLLRPLTRREAGTR